MTVYFVIPLLWVGERYVQAICIGLSCRGPGFVLGTASLSLLDTSKVWVSSTYPKELIYMSELGRLSLLLNKGFGTGIMQKDQPQQPENGTKMNHLHFHVFPRLKDEEGLFPVPEPNSFEGFVTPTDEEARVVAESLR